ncbi:AAA family ATPase [Alteromonas sp. KUL49]|uniref:AAA family ATPase n=1 Tax=Alteromonas sp. KUL49 TaxID=2480798 RepID=UPI00102F23F6|nr:AAA family ATPase [Alteromonas sp. KUL49]TAP41010.1 shikimate kinase [Alteromonas sp. KUL49]GEA11205.1 hypothetical protein KUL49_15800 [Alteromonas sp. KUL49]
MSKTLIFGNSGAGKSTLAKAMSEYQGVGHLDLDTVAWLPSSPPERMPINESMEKITSFLNKNTHWVIEGCYADLISQVTPHADKIVFLNLPTSVCVDNAKARPWEPHKYESKEAQDANLDMLLDWIKDYDNRTDTFSRVSHQRLFDNFDGENIMVTTNEESKALQERP